MNKTDMEKGRKKRRLIGWIVFYGIIITGFLTFLYIEGKRINIYALPQGKINLTVSKSQYYVGEKVSFTIHNGLASNIYVNNKCPQEPLNVYRWSNKTWVRIHDTAKISSCVNEPREVVIAANSSVTSDYANWPNLFSTPGIYRLVAVVDNYNGLVYRDFDVVSKPVNSTPQKPVYIYQQVPVYVPVGGGDGGGD